MVEGASPRLERTIQVAERVNALLREHGVDSALIGGMALAAHKHARATDDFDIGTDTDPFSVLPKIAAALEREGFRVELRLPDADDPLGGVIDVEGSDFDLVQVVNFLNPLAARHNALAAEAIKTAVSAEGTTFRVVDLPHLVALKLQAGSPADIADVCALLASNPEADVQAVREVCRRFGFDQALAAALKT